MAVSKVDGVSKRGYVDKEKRVYRRDSRYQREDLVPFASRPSATLRPLDQLELFRPLHYWFRPHVLHSSLDLIRRPVS